jgi:hypothetical protein
MEGFSQNGVQLSGSATMPLQGGAVTGQAQGFEGSGFSADARGGSPVQLDLRQWDPGDAYSALDPFPNHDTRSFREYSMRPMQDMFMTEKGIPQREALPEVAAPLNIGGSARSGVSETSGGSGFSAYARTGAPERLELRQWDPGDAYSALDHLPKHENGSFGGSRQMDMGVELTARAPPPAQNPALIAATPVYESGSEIAGVSASSDEITDSSVPKIDSGPDQPGIVVDAGAVAPEVRMNDGLEAPAQVIDTGQEAMIAVNTGIVAPEMVLDTGLNAPDPSINTGGPAGAG